MWEECLPHVEFAYNRAEHSTTKVSPFQVVYGFNPHAPIDLLSLPTTERIHSDARERADFIRKLHETTKANIESMNKKYRIAGSKGRKEIKLEPSDLVWLHLRKDRFPKLRKSKLMPRAAGPYKIIEKINDNAYKLELPPEFGVSPTFNIVDLKPYLGEEDELESRTTPIQEGEDDKDITPSDVPADPPTVMQGPMTRTRMRQLNLAILFILLRIDYYLMMLFCLGTLERVMRDLEDVVEAMMTSKDVQQKPEAQSNMISSLSRPPRPVCLKLVTQDASGLCF